MKKETLAKIKDELKNWKNIFKNELSKNQKSQINLYIIDKEWLNNFEESFLFFELSNSVLNKKTKEKDYISFNSMQLKLKEKLLDNYSSIPKIEIFVLNENCYKVFQLTEKEPGKAEKIIGYFYNKILLLQLNNTTQQNNINLCIFFLDNQNQIRQGYLSVNNKNLFEVKYEFEKSEPLEIFNKYKISINDNNIIKQLSNKFSLYIFQNKAKRIKKEDPKINFMKIDGPSYKEIFLSNLQFHLMYQII